MTYNGCFLYFISIHAVLIKCFPVGASLISLDNIHLHVASDSRAMNWSKPLFPMTVHYRIQWQFSGRIALNKLLRTQGVFPTIHSNIDHVNGAIFCKLLSSIENRKEAIDFSSGSSNIDLELSLSTGSHP